MDPIRWVEEAKRRAALKAVAHVRSGHIVGLGSGSTAEYAIKEMGRRVKKEGLSIKGIPSSFRTAEVARRSNVPLTSLDANPVLDVAIDGADQIDPNLNLIKGRGGALTREKIVDSAARLFIVIADETKLVKHLGENEAGVPIEVLPIAARVVMKKIQKLGGKSALRMARGKLVPFRTDNNNFIVDAKFGVIRDPESLETKIKSIPGVIETGLFIGMADLAYIGCKRGIKVLRKSQ